MNLLEYRREIDKAVKTYLELEIAKNPPTEAKTLLKRLQTITKDGRRFRPILFFLLYEAYGGKDKAIEVGVAIELLHQALLIHDDLIDDDSVRHGTLNITGLYAKEYKDATIASSMSLLAGDLMLTLFATPILTSQTLILQQKVDSLYIFSEILKTCIYGQQLDSLNVSSSKDISMQTILSIYSLKTTSYSCLLPTRLVTSLLKLSKKEQQLTDNFANSLGTYLQLINDHNDYQTTLKDFILGKDTPPYLLAKKLVGKEEYQILTRYFGSGSLLPKDKQKIKSILTKSGVIKASQDLISDYHKDCQHQLNQLDISNISKEGLLALIDSIKV